MIFSFIHQTHYSTAYRMFLDKPIFGHGIKMFRYLCKDYEYKPKKFIIDPFNNQTASSYGCSTHPHNTYMQILAETGLIGLLFLLSLLIYLLTKIINMIKNNNVFIPENTLLIGIFVNIWPIIPTGNFLIIG